jgi:hypothetical protein
MIGFVVVVKSNCPDLLLKLCHTRQEAAAYAAAVTLAEIEQIDLEAGFGRGVCGEVYLTVVEFRHGLPIREDCVREFGEYSNSLPSATPAG